MGETKLVKALVTGFEGWLGKTNPAGVIAKSLDGAKINDLEVVGREIPEDFTKIPSVIKRLIAEVQPEIFLGLGWDYTKGIKVERIALNVMDSDFWGEIKPDNYGNTPHNQRIFERAPLALESTLPVDQIVQTLKNSGIFAFASYFAGTHCCNTVMYSALYYSRRSKRIAGFVHIPPIPGMFENTPTMELDQEKKAIELVLQVCRTHFKS
ncbi:hypothetical protein B9Q13_06110 [Candidatus Marsarchaeota G2 archaeon ECH_B_SAG-G16]|uniref:Pyroglutamyl-peptidase I n=1 Tax=Candidatus Marsarchaeota G2 archaeon ECH_B_SAG-G16 TaxID=1978167 RepID=A0A2R6BZ52_9ARCH|nr:MAG: hypothetical protein B9Q13_06110 [Candidatus Marsarchaeota G2 archaeon ECH_B_SAG-G16]